MTKGQGSALDPVGPSRECVLRTTAPDPHLFGHLLSNGVWGLVPSGSRAEPWPSF